MAATASEAPTSPNADKTVPGHDIFCTPDNSYFRSKAPYKALDTSIREIRLIVVSPDDGSGLIKCELLHNVPLANVQGQYFALSYCAGDVHKTDTVLVDSIRFTVFANLKHALASAQHFFKMNPEKLLKDGKFLMWVDQICINQDDLIERSHQVGFMRDIYQSAQETLICLSTSENEGSGMRWLLELCEKVPPLTGDVFDHYRQPGEPGDAFDSYQPVEPGAGFYIPSRLHHYHWYRLLRYLTWNFGTERFITGWFSFYDLIESPWWSRAWVFQEFIASPTVSLLCWNSSVSWTKASPILRSFCFLYRDKRFTPGRLEGTSESHPLIRRIKGPNAHLAVDRVRFMINSKIQDVGSSMDLKQLLAHSRYCKASDDRDRVFAFLGLAHPGYGLVPNYSTDNDISDVLIETTKRIILYEDHLGVLSHAVISDWLGRRKLPSWVADWTCEEVSGSQRSSLRPLYWECIEKRSGANANASFRIIKSLQWHCLTVALEVSGIFVDTIRTDQRLLPPTASSAYERLLRPQVPEKGNWRKFQTRDYDLDALRRVQEFDQLWILDGAIEAMILRREHQGYRLISGARIVLPRHDQGIMVIEESLGVQDKKSERILII